MSRLPSPETQLRTMRALLKRTQSDLATAKQQASEYRARATKAEQDATEWKQRFDILLRREERQAPAMKKEASHG
jgi:hypothetical protein